MFASCKSPRMCYSIQIFDVGMNFVVFVRNTYIQDCVILPCKDFASGRIVLRQGLFEANEVAKGA